MAKVLAAVGGVALRPGVSLNRRLYTRPMIAAAVQQAQKAIESGTLAQLTHHDAEDDSTQIVGRVTSMTLDDDGNARYTAEIADTPHGRTIASLADTSDGHAPFLSGVSIRGYWKGTVRKVKGPDGQPVETADGIELAGLDWTKTPGVPGAGVDTFAWADRTGRTETTERVLITESAEADDVTFTDEAPPAAVPESVRALLPGPPHIIEDGACATCAESEPAAAQVFADPGYRPDKARRYPVETQEHARASWAALHDPQNSGAYTGPQLKQVKGRVVRALRKSGLAVSGARETADWVFGAPSEITAEMLAECGVMMAGPQTSGGWSVSACNGPVDIRLSSYGMDPASLDPVLRAAADAVCKALATLDPDMDGDIDVPGAGPEDTDHDQAGESAADDPVIAEQELLASLRAEVEAARAALAEAGGGKKPKPKPAGMSDAIRSAFLKDLKNDTPPDIATGMRRLSQWAASGHYPSGTSYGDLKWFYDQCAKELKSRNPKSSAGGNFPPGKGG